MERQSDATASTEAITGWSAKDDIVGKSVFNENDEKIGDVDDIVISSDGRTLYLLIGAGGFLGMGSKNVAVPFDRFERQDDRILLSGYTKEQLKALPEVSTRR
jgi:sporulation protein YlmC with PRC-barrel domain